MTKILRQNFCSNFFPVYVTWSQKACCRLAIIQSESETGKKIGKEHDRYVSRSLWQYRKKFDKDVHSRHVKFLVIGGNNMTISMDRKLKDYMQESNKKDIVVYTTRCNS